jgi:hypothetical protein
LNAAAWFAGCAALSLSWTAAPTALAMIT